MNVGEKLKSHQQLSNNAASQVDYKLKRLQHFNSRTVKGAKHWTGRKFQFQVPIKQQTSENKKKVSFCPEIGLLH